MLPKILLSAATALSCLSQVVFSAPTALLREDGTVEITVDHYNSEKRDIEKRSIYLKGWDGCSDSQKQDIMDSWKNMLDMANKIKGTIDFNEVVAKDFLGDPGANSRYQNNIRSLIEGVTTWTLGGLLDWHLKMTCNDFKRVEAVSGQPADFGCPKGTAEADYYKCKSRCWNYRKNPDGSVREWIHGSIAYTVNWNSVHVGAMNWCPGWFEMNTCNDRYQHFSRATGDSKWDMLGYQCREQAMVHELFHLDAHSDHASSQTGHVYDRKIKIYNQGTGGFDIISAYGPLYTKVLANWTKRVGFFVATNADNLAFYFLGKWIQNTGGYYPDRPRTHDIPQESPGTTNSKRDATANVFDPIQIVDGKVAQGDPNDLAKALGEMYNNDAQVKFEYKDPDTDCLDISMSADNTTWGCYTTDSDKNDELELDASIGYPTVQPLEGLICGAGDDTIDSKVKSYYQAVGQFADGEWRVYNMDCSVANNLIPHGSACDGDERLFGCDDSSGTMEFKTMIAGGQNYNCIPAQTGTICGQDRIGQCCQYVDKKDSDPVLPGF